MGKLKKRHNWRARQTIETVGDETKEDTIHVEIPGLHSEGHDEANLLVLPSTRRKTQVAQCTAPPKRLSKKEKKRLEKIVSQKNKKAKRADLLESLQRVQAKDEELLLLTSTTDVYSGKLKRKHSHDREDVPGKVNAISGSNKKSRGPSLLATAVDSSDNTSDEDTEEEEEEEEEEEGQEEREMDNEVDVAHGDIMKAEAGNSCGAGSEAPCSVSPQESLPPARTHTSLHTAHMHTSPGQQGKRKTATERKEVLHIPVNRSPEIQACRLQLPILGEEQCIMEAITEHPITIMCGETGCGKTTQVPQFLYEAGYTHGKGIIGITEPRRVAAISMSKRVAQEMGLSSREVSYQIRYEGNVTRETCMKFMTDGILLKEVQLDFLLTAYSVIILDEAHERSVYTDLLLGLLSRIVPLREKRGNPLKVIVMSATLRVEDFTANPHLFKVPPPVIKVDSRQYPVSIHFNKRTPLEDYVGEAFKKICKIHQQLPAGGILVFVTGQQEIHTLCAKLRSRFPVYKKGHQRIRNESKEDEIQLQHSHLPGISLDDYSVLPQDEEAEEWEEEAEDGFLEEVDQESEEDSSEEMASAVPGSVEPLHVLPLYSLLPSHRQAKVFEPPPAGSRLCVVATNVAETSLTIPNVKYVLDTGKVKTKFYDKVTGVSTFKVTWTSKASANQRAGRAGRTGAGHCYRLYSSAVFNNEFEEFSPPEIARRPVEDLLLQMKDLGIDRVVNFPFPTLPDSEALLASEKLLLNLGAIGVPGPESKATSKMPASKITPLGHAMACFPVSPRYGKMLCVGHQHQLLPYVVTIVAALSVQELLRLPQPSPSDEQQGEELKQHHLRLAQIRRTWSAVGHSRLLGDLMVLLKAVGAAEYAGNTREFCDEHGVSYKGIVEVRKLRHQLTNAVNAVISEANLVLDPKLPPPNDTQAKLLRQIILAGLGDHVARRVPEPPSGTEKSRIRNQAYQSIAMEEPVYIHPSSVLYKQNMEYVIYQYMEETSRFYMHGVVAIEPEWLAIFAPERCQFSKPLDEPSPRYEPVKDQMVCHCTATFGPHCWPIPAVEVGFPDGAERYKWFARSLLEGRVCPALQRFVPHLLSKPATMIKTWAKLQPRTESLLRELINRQVHSKKALLIAWQQEPQYLLNAYAEWIPQSMFLDLETLWPHMGPDQG